MEIDAGIFETAIAKVEKVSKEDAEIRQILVKVFDVEGEENAGYKAAALEAVECGVAVINMFLAIRSPDKPRTMRVITDLTMGLNSNQFWQRNAPSLVPMLQAAIFDFFDDTNLAVERSTDNKYILYDGISTAAKLAPVAIVAYMLYLLGGPKLAIANTLILKKQLYKFFVG